MKTRHAATLSILLALAGMPLVAACDREGPAERAGKKVDKAVDDVKDKIDPPGPAEKAGREVDRAVDDLKD